MSFICAKPGDMLTFTYLNHKGVTSVRKVFFVGVDYGSNEYYPEPQWLLRCTDPERDNAHRSFAIANISGPIDVQHYEQIDLEKGFFQQMCAAASESNWIPPEYHANDWVADVCTFLREGPEREPPKPIAPIPNSIVASYTEGVEGPKVGDGSGDAALAIGEHAFTAGFKAGVSATGHDPSWEVYGKAGYDAWSNYDPPEHIKELS